MRAEEGDQGRVEKRDRRGYREEQGEGGGREGQERGIGYR